MRVALFLIFWKVERQISSAMMIMLALFLLLVLPAPVLADTLAGADALYRNGDFKSAAEIYRASVQQDPKNEKAQAGLIRSLLNNDEVEAARASLALCSKTFRP